MDCMSECSYENSNSNSNSTSGTKSAQSGCFDAEEQMELHQTCMYLMQEFVDRNPHLITDPDFHDYFDESIDEMMHSISLQPYQEEDHDEDTNNHGDNPHYDLDIIIEVSKREFFTHVMPRRSYDNSATVPFPAADRQPQNERYQRRIQELKAMPQPAQRTPEWYLFRSNLITASNAYKAYSTETEATRNQLIYEKCKAYQVIQEREYCRQMGLPFAEDTYRTSIQSAMHHGQKYEPLSVLLYEHAYQVKVDDFGCIQHAQYPFLGASPDGIVTTIESDRFGRMLEIKNVVSREITGIPKQEYWIQMQLQMEVCDLDECDFLETKFVEYPDRAAFNQDVLSITDMTSAINMCKSADGQVKGVMIHFYTPQETHVYLYKPLDLVTSEAIDEWITTTFCEHRHWSFMRYIYWKCDVLSCVLVCRNRKWFQDTVHELKELWDIVLDERVRNVDHRAPKKRGCRSFQDDTSSNSASAAAAAAAVAGLEDNTTPEEDTREKKRKCIVQVFTTPLQLRLTKQKKESVDATMDATMHMDTDDTQDGFARQTRG